MDIQKIYVNYIPTSYDANTIEQLFSAYGKITEVNYPIDKDTNQPKGYAFITFLNPKSAQRALEKNNEELDGKTLIVELAKERISAGKSQDKDIND